MNILQTVKIGSHMVGKWAAKNAPEILTGVAIGSGIMAVVVTVPATTSAEKKLLEEKTRRIENGDAREFTKMDAIKSCWKCYIPTLIALGTSITASIFSNRISASRMAAVAAAYSISERHLKEYQDKVVEMYGPEKDKEIRGKIAQDHMKEHTAPEDVVATGNGDYLVLDLVTGQKFRTNMENVYRAFKTASDCLAPAMGSVVSLNDLYDELCLPHFKGGDKLGWGAQDFPLNPTFSTTIAANGEPCLTIDYDCHAVNIGYDDFRDY